MATRVLAVCLAVLFAAEAAAAEVEFKMDDKGAQAAVAKQFAEQISESRAAGASETIMTARVDLDDDGTADMLGMVSSGYVCIGASGCPIGVFKGAADGTFRYLTSVYADVLEVLDSKSKGMRDLNLGSLGGMQRVGWNGSEYQRK
jgi:hypothetical protein